MITTPVILKFREVKATEHSYGVFTPLERKEGGLGLVAHLKSSSPYYNTVDQLGKHIKRYKGHYRLYGFDKPENLPDMCSFATINNPSDPNKNYLTYASFNVLGKKERETIENIIE